jgi:hypothetical protein
MTEKEQWDAVQAYQMTGGPAFPVMVPEAKIVYTGISIRDYFAAMAMQGMLANDTDCGPEQVPIIATSAYVLADAMLKERLK